MRTKEYFDNFAKNLDRLAWNVGTAPWADWAWAVVAQEIGPATGCLIVDLGTGTGAGIANMLRFTRGAQFLGVDFSEAMLERARVKRLEPEEGAQVEFLHSRIDRLDLPEASVGYFVSSGTFHHIKNKRKVLRRLFSMLRPGGKLVNVDHFRIGPHFAQETEKKRREHPQEALETDRVRREFQWIYDQDVDHPIEFHVDPYEFEGLLVEAGFVDGRVHVSLLPGYAVVSARKPGVS